MHQQPVLAASQYGALSQILCLGVVLCAVDSYFVNGMSIIIVWPLIISYEASTKYDSASFENSLPVDFGANGRPLNGVWEYFVDEPADTALSSDGVWW